ncbi:MAG: glycosyltransferase [Acidobacteriota bacterium]|nr:glycosyltransferase [Acidobacteriota bacterium]
MRPARVFIPHTALGQGGAERVLIQLLGNLDRDLLVPSLGLTRDDGELRARVPSDVTVHHTPAKSLWGALPSLTRTLAREKPDIVFSMGAISVPVAFALAMLRSKVRFVISERNMLHHTSLTPKRWLITLLKRFSYRRADQIIAVSEGVADDLESKLKLSREKIEVLYNPVVDSEMLAQAREPLSHVWLEDGMASILAVGRLVPQKDYPTLIRAFKQVRAERSARLIILGDGPLKSELQGLIEAQGLAQDVELAGFDANPFKYMSRATVFALSSIHEGLPGALIQAMACGAAVVSTDCPSGPSEIIENGIDGYLVPIRDDGALASRIVQLLDQPELRRELAAGARLSAERFRVETVVRAYERVLLGEADNMSARADS